MFIQVIQGRCTKQAELRQMADTWQAELGPTAVGFLGGTYGFTDDDQFIGVVRFESRDAARRNSERAEQNAWAQRMMQLMDGPTRFHDCDDVTVVLDGGSDDAGFVQVIQGRLEDPSILKAMVSDTTMLHEMRPDIIGGTIAIEEDGTYTETIAFTDESNARKGEGVEPPPEVRESLETVRAGAQYFDLHHPWFESAR